MKIGIITSGFDMLGLFKILSKYDNEYHVYLDWNNGPYGDKDYSFCIEKIQDGINYLEKKVDYIIIPGVFEKHFENNNKIIPLLKTYIYDFGLKYSTIGKIGFVGDYSDVESIQDYFNSIKSNYKHSQNQLSTNKFNLNFPIWIKNTPLWKFYTIYLGNYNPMVRKTIKFDIKYFSDANIDTLIPLNWSYLFLEKIIKSKLGKIRFYDSNTVEKILLPFIDKKSEYKIILYCNGNNKILLEQKKWLRLLNRGSGKENIDIKII